MDRCPKKWKVEGEALGTAGPEGRRAGVEVRWVRDAEHKEMQKENKGEKVARRNGSKEHRK